jgi:hypothetical protein
VVFSSIPSYTTNKRATEYDPKAVSSPFPKTYFPKIHLYDILSYRYRYFYFFGGRGCFTMLSVARPGLRKLQSAGLMRPVRTFYPAC